MARDGRGRVVKKVLSFIAAVFVIAFGLFLAAAVVSVFTGALGFGWGVGIGIAESVMP